jgi:DNA-binding transcriptional LysR family regulator
MALEPKRLIELLSIAETGSFTKAAAARRVSQPALSNSMAVLEQSLGVRDPGRRIM